MRALGAQHEDLERLRASNLSDAVADYNLFMERLIGLAGMHQTFPYGMSFAYNSDLGKPVEHAQFKQIMQLALDCYDLIIKENVPGAVVEFGVASGFWIKQILDHMDSIGSTRETWGFDSFEGLPEPDKDYDGPYWEKGQYAYGLDSVTEYLNGKSRPHVHLVKGWFSDTLPQPQAQSIKKIAYAKVDCDLYHPAVECLDYLTGRLTDGAILMFDDWTMSSGTGETRAFMEWVPKVPQYRFEMIGFFNYRIYFRVRSSEKTPT